MARLCSVVLLLIGSLVLESALLVRPATAAGSGSISGHVTDRDGRPVAGTRVRLDGPGDVRADRFTDDHGRFVVDGLPAGSYTVCFIPDGQDLAAECWSDYEIGYGYTTVPVSDGEAVTGIDAVLLAASHLRGTVTDSRGRPIEGALVSTSWQPFGEDQPVYWFGEPVVTAADGSFDTGPLSSGWYQVRFSDTRSNRYATEWWKDAPEAAVSTRIRLDRGASVDGLDAELGDLAHLSGRVTGVDGRAADGATVRIFRVTSSQTRTEVGSVSAVAADGSYELTGLQPGSYRVQFDAAPGRYRTEYWRDARTFDTAADVVVAGAEPVTRLDAVLDLAPPVRVTRRPTVVGHARVGHRLRVDEGAWDVGALRLTYRWRADGVAIPGATGRRILLTPRLRGAHIAVRVTATATARERSPGHATTGRTPPVRPAFTP